MKSSLLVCTGPGQLELQSHDIAEPEGNEIQVQVHTSLISPGTERAFILGLKNTSDNYPSYPGYSFSGTVHKVGKGVTRFKIGDPVAGFGIPHRSIGNIEVERVVPILEGISFERAAFLALGVIALQGVRKARIELGEEVMVLGLGLVGQLALQLARISGSSPAIGVDLAESRLQMAFKCGADFIINSSDVNWAEKLKQITDGKGPRVVIESTGVPEAIEAVLEAAGNFGRVVLLGSTRGDSTVDFYRYVHKKGITVLGAHIYANAKLESRPGYWTWQDDAFCFMALLQRTRISVDPLITERFQWTKILDAYKGVLSWNTDIMGTLIQWQKD